MGYTEKMTKQYLLWAPDLKQVIKSHAVKCAKNEKGGSVDVRLHRQTPSILSERRPVGRPHKNAVMTETHIDKPSATATAPLPPMDDTDPQASTQSKLTAVNED